MNPFTLITLVLAVVNFYISGTARNAVRGSRQRYLWQTARRISSWALNISWLVAGIAYLIDGDPANSLTIAINFAAFVVFTIVELKMDDHDDWFTGRGKKIKDGAKRALNNLRSSFAGKLSPATT